MQVAASGITALALKADPAQMTDHGVYKTGADGRVANLYVPGTVHVCGGACCRGGGTRTAQRQPWGSGPRKPLPPPI